MSVDERLRAGLEANAGFVVPDGELRLAQLHRRLRRRRAGLAGGAAAVVAIVLVGAVVGGDMGARGIDPVLPPSPSVSESPEPAGARIPDSNWRKVITRDQAVAAGADAAWLRENFGRQAPLVLALAFIGDVYSQSARYPGGWGVGDAGTVAFEDPGRLVVTSSSTGCRGCVATLGWRIQGERLLLSNLSGSSVSPIDRLIFEGSWKIHEP